MAKKETFKTKEEIERDGNVNLSVGTQKEIKIRCIGGKYDGLVIMVPELKGRIMIGNGKAEQVRTPKPEAVDPENHEIEAGKLKAKRDEKAETKE